MQKRLICPKCGDPRQTCAITESGGRTWGKCFRDSCGYKINKNTDMKYEDLVKSKTNSKPRREPILVSARGIPRAWKFVQRWRLEEDLEHIKYDVKDDRIVFIQHDLMLGKVLDKGRNPKWYHYKLTKHPFVINSLATDTIVLVEDVISCLTAGKFIDCMALLGTNFKESYLPYIKDYDRIIVALDADASNQAVKLQTYLNSIKPTSVVFLQQDIKDMSDKDLNKFRETVND